MDVNFPKRRIIH